MLSLVCILLSVIDHKCYEILRLHIVPDFLLNHKVIPIFIFQVESIVLSIISMLSSPNDESPANVEAAVSADALVFCSFFLVTHSLLSLNSLTHTHAHTHTQF